MEIANEPVVPELRWEKRLEIEHPRDRLAAAIVATLRSYENILLAMETRALELKERAMGERMATRQEIVKRHQAINGPNSQVQTSQQILSVRTRAAGLEIVWKEIWYPRTHDRHAKPKGRYNNVGRMKKSGVDLRNVVHGAHPDEKVLLRRHEMEARVIRGLWKQAKAAQRELETLGQRVLKLLEAADGDDSK